MVCKQVKKIPNTFTSSQEYLDSFIDPLIEETRVALSSSLSTLSESFWCEIKYIHKSKGFDLDKGRLFYTVKLEEYMRKKTRDKDYDSDDDEDELAMGDLIAITHVKPRWYGDLDRPGWPFLVSLITRVKDCGSILSIQSSRLILTENHNEYGGRGRQKERDTLYAVKLMNLTTHTRIWSALNSNPEIGNFRIIKNLLGTPFVVRT